MTKRKKGFTIVELVIVIAVIGILAGILIPTFANLIHNANVASDGALIRELNNALASDLNQPHETIYDALNATDNFGFNVQKINAQARNNKILWDSKNDVFCYLQDGVVEYQNTSIKNADKLAAGDYRLWICSKTVDDTYSTYLYNYNGNKDIVITKGLDTSDSTNAGKIDSVKYDRHDATVAQNVVIRTNGEALTIDAPLDNVKHYGEASSLNVIAVAGSSYRENGKVAFVEISKGRIVLEASSEVNHIHVNAKTETTFDTVIIAKEANVEMPTLSRDDVEIAPQGTLVVALQNGTGEVNAQSDIDYVWLTKQGIYEQIKVSNSATNAGNVWVNTSNKPAETKEAAQQIANNIGLTATVGAQEYNVSVNEDRDIVLTTTNEVTGLEEVAYTITADNSGNAVIKDAENNEVAEEVAQQVQNGAVEAQPDKADIQTGATLFAGGTGSENDPYLIVDFRTMQNITFYSNRAYDSRYYAYYSSQSNGTEFVREYESNYGPYNANYANWDVYYKVKDGVSIINCSENNQKWVAVDLIGNFDGNGVVFKNLVNATLFDGINSKGNKATVVKNFTVDNCLIMKSSYYIGAVARYCYYDVTFEDINISGYLEANSPASFLGQGNFYDTDCKISFVRCHSSMNLVSLNAQCGGFTGNLYGSYYNKNHTCLVELVDSYFDGSIAVASGTRYSYIECHTASPIAYSISYTNETLENECSSLYSKGQTQAKDVAYLGNTRTLTKTALSLPNIGESFTVAKASSAISAKAYVIVGLNPGNFTGVFISEEIDLSGVTNSFTTDEVKNYNVVVNDGEHNKTEIIGNTLYIYDSRYVSGYGSLTFMVVQYDALGGIVSVSTVSK